MRILLPVLTFFSFTGSYFKYRGSSNAPGVIFYAGIGEADFGEDLVV